jgi:DNA-binding beta-propeller fold protein YncE
MNGLKQKLKSKWLKRSLWALLGSVLALVGYALLQLIEPVSIAPIVAQSPAQFAGRALLVASDADMVATAYADAKLDRVLGVEDTLTVVGLPLNVANPAIAPIPVSNSVMSWPQIIAVSPNGQRAYVAEVRSRPAEGIQAFDNIDQMPDGAKVTVVDLGNPLQPKVIESVDLGRNPEHLSISPDGKFLAVNLEDPGRELLIIELQADGRLGQRSYFPMSIDGSRQDNRAAIWHPSGQYLAMTQDKNRRVGFYQVNRKEGAIAVTPVGEPLTVGNHLSNARFTMDGRFLLVPDLKWSTWSTQLLSNLLNPKGEMIAIRFEPEPGQSPEVVSRVEVGLSPEGFALSPDNSLIATVNMRRTFLPNMLPAWRGKPYSSLSLVKFDRNSGQLTTVGTEYGFEGLLPEQATFDAAGKSLAVVIYNYREPSPKNGAIEFWNVIAGDNPRLERTSTKIDVVRGAHNIVLVP